MAPRREWFDELEGCSMTAFWLVLLGGIISLIAGARDVALTCLGVVAAIWVLAALATRKRDKDKRK